MLIYFYDICLYLLKMLVNFQNRCIMNSVPRRWGGLLLWYNFLGVNFICFDCIVWKWVGVLNIILISWTPPPSQQLNKHIRNTEVVIPIQKQWVLQRKSSKPKCSRSECIKRALVRKLLLSTPLLLFYKVYPAVPAFCK